MVLIKDCSQHDSFVNARQFLESNFNPYNIDDVMEIFDMNENYDSYRGYCDNTGMDKRSWNTIVEYLDDVIGYGVVKVIEEILKKKDEYYFVNMDYGVIEVYKLNLPRPIE